MPPRSSKETNDKQTNIKKIMWIVPNFHYVSVKCKKKFGTTRATMAMWFSFWWYMFQT